MDDWFKPQVEEINYNGRIIKVGNSSFGKMKSALKLIKDRELENEDDSNNLDLPLEVLRAFVIDPDLSEKSDEDVYHFMMNSGGLNSDLINACMIPVSYTHLTLPTIYSV